MTLPLPLPLILPPNGRSISFKRGSLLSFHGLKKAKCWKSRAFGEQNITSRHFYASIEIYHEISYADLASSNLDGSDRLPLGWVRALHFRRVPWCGTWWWPARRDRLFPRLPQVPVAPCGTWRDSAQQSPLPPRSASCMSWSSAGVCRPNPACARDSYGPRPPGNGNPACDNDIRTGRDKLTQREFTRVWIQLTVKESVEDALIYLQTFEQHVIQTTWKSISNIMSWVNANLVHRQRARSSSWL